MIGLSIDPSKVVLGGGEMEGQAIMCYVRIVKK